MGVHDINKTIRENISEPFISLARQNNYNINEYVFHKGMPLDNLRGLKVAFDSANIMYATNGDFTNASLLLKKNKKQN